MNYRNTRRSENTRSENTYLETRFTKLTLFCIRQQFFFFTYSVRSEDSSVTINLESSNIPTNASGL